MHVFDLSGHGLCDMGAYDRFFTGELEYSPIRRRKSKPPSRELPTID